MALVFCHSQGLVDAELAHAYCRRGKARRFAQRVANTADFLGDVCRIGGADTLGSLNGHAELKSQTWALLQVARINGVDITTV